VTEVLDIAVRGVALRVTPFQRSFWEKLNAGRWEQGTLDTLDAHVGPGVEVLDIGAWVGPITLYAAACGAARVIAVEPDPAAAAALRDNLALNPSLADRVTVIERAVTAAPGPVRLGARRKPGDSMSSVLLTDAATTWEAEGVTPADLAAMLTPGAPALIKIDIEGGEYALGTAIAPLARRPRTVTLLSFHPQFLPEPQGAAALTCALLRPFAGAQVWRMDARGLRRAWVVEALARAGVARLALRGIHLFIRT
jgi:FkbM family methyltransferase